MQPLIIKQLAYDLTPVAGLALVGHHLKRLAPVFADIDRALPVRTGVATSDVLRSSLELLAQGKRANSVPLRTSGKRVAMWEQALHIEGIEQPLRRVLPLTERTIDARGQHLIEPQLSLEGWSTSLPQERFAPAAIIALYANHGTHDQFHAEFKTDMDLERLPAGKFDTNYLVCALGALTMNILRLLGQADPHRPHGPHAPVRHEASRRRIKTVLQELVYRTGRLIEHGRQLILGLGANDRAAVAFVRLHGQLAAASG